MSDSGRPPARVVAGVRKPDPARTRNEQGEESGTPQTSVAAALGNTASSSALAKEYAMPVMDVVEKKKLEPRRDPHVSYGVQMTEALR